MDVFDLRDQLIGDYRRYVASFMALRDRRIRERVQTSLDEGTLWPEPSIGLNPAFEPGGWIDELVAEGLLDVRCAEVFRAGKAVGGDPRGTPMRLHRHQVDAIREARAGRNYVLTTGTGSGKSLAYLVPIVDHVLRQGSGGGVKAIVVYPMNALANSQTKELEKFLVAGAPGGRPPVTFQRYTGQESDEARRAIIESPPDIILTNYVMLELILTRVRDRALVQRAQGLRFLVLDELHTYRGRQGADVALLVRRLREASGSANLGYVGTSATLSTAGSLDEAQTAVAAMATTIFGAPVAPSSVVGETLRRATPELDFRDPATVADLSRRLGLGPGEPTDYDTFVADPLSSWIEQTFGIHEVDGRLVRVAPRPITGPGGGARELAEIGGVDVDRAAELIRAQLMAGYRVRHPTTAFPAFAFRLHQFISKGDTVFASPEPEETRHLTLNGQRFVPGHRDTVLLPLSFCRQCGQEYYVARRILDGTGVSRLVPRQLGDRQAEPASAPGFLYLSTEHPWPDEPDEVIERLPEDWLEETPKGTRVKYGHTKLLPKAVRVDIGGCLDEGGTLAWWVPAPLRLCLLCGVAYGGHVKSDFTKLATLGSEGRSTATTVLSLSAVRTLRAATELAPAARKLLSFTDNRQDAALQAGHFNDFVQVSLLRAGLYQALAKAGPDGLEHDRITDAAFASLALPFDHYAVDPELEFHARTDTEKVLRDVLGYHLYIDLRRGWRVTSPNLEQCGLLEIAYVSLPEVCAAEHIWSDRHPVLASATPEERLAVATTLLDHLRRELAIKVDFLDIGFQERLAQRSSQRLVGPWALDDKDTLEFAVAVLPRSRRPGDYRGWSYLSPRSGFARYLRRSSTFAGRAEPLKGDEALAAVIGDLLSGLRRAGLVEEVLTSADGVAGYQVPASAMRWRAGEGTRAYRDPVRTPTAASGSPEPSVAPNAFFVDLYRNLARDLVGVEAREHTAQVPAIEREERELAFRDATLPVLYCSPTMELGVDIAELNVVNLRNVPPTPANYAQRSGRAGRSGQPALVFTYCSAGSPHDQWFFRRPQLMVSGQVSTPRIDVANQDLVRAHVQAVWLAASGLSLGRSLKDLLDINEGATDLPLNQAVRGDLHDAGARVRARQVAERVLADLRGELEASSWWSPTWLDDTIGAIPQAFEGATQRWRTLYRSASHQFDTQNKVIRNPAAASEDKRVAKRLRREAEIQLELLTADVDTASRSDFYSYRYFASEGFLPGYSFPRLPLSAFIPAGAGRRIDGEFVSRPRFLAISEFGPRSLVYHEGSRYQINRVILPVSDALDPSGDPVLTGEIKRCASCGYIHPLDDDRAPDLCERCGVALGATLRGMFRMHNVATRRRDRINSDEEERQRQGFEIETGVRFAVRHGRPSMRSAEVRADGEVLATLTYADTATLWRANLGQRRRANPEQRGFMLDIDRGYWAKESDDDPSDSDPLGPRCRRVIPYVEDTRNALLFEPAEHLEAEVMASLQAALKHAIQVSFQLEDDELATEALPSADDRRLLLLFESAEGGAGVLRRLVDEPGALATVATTALELCHIDVASGQDLGGPPGGERCEAACYECLLSYRNQLDHQLLDRALVRPVLEALARAAVMAGAGPATAAEHIEHLKGAADSDLERRWLDHLRAGRLRLPDRAQVLVAEAGTRPDFVYTDAAVAVYVDGPHHLDPARAARDATQSDAMRDLGWRVIRFGHLDDWSATLERHRNVFGDGT